MGVLVGAGGERKWGEEGECARCHCCAECESVYSGNGRDRGLRKNEGF